MHSANSSEGLCTCGVEWLQSTRGEGTEMATSGLFQKFGLSADEVRQLIRRAGNDRQKLEEVARTLTRT